MIRQMIRKLKIHLPLNFFRASVAAIIAPDVRNR